LKKRPDYIILSALACIIACVGDFIALFVLGTWYPGYSHLKDTMSALGSSISPVSDEISLWWMILGVLFIFFGTGFYKAFSAKGGYAKFASGLIILYGIGEGIGSGIFKADRIENGLTTSGVYHEILGGIGVISIILFPLIMQKLITKNKKPIFYLMSQIVFISGIILMILFLFRFSTNENNFFSIYKGLWQRLFVLNSYIYLSVIAIQMIKTNTREKQWK